MAGVYYAGYKQKLMSHQNGHNLNYHVKGIEFTVNLLHIKCMYVNSQTSNIVRAWVCACVDINKVYYSLFVQLW